MFSLSNITWPVCVLDFKFVTLFKENLCFLIGQIPCPMGTKDISCASLVVMIWMCCLLDFSSTGNGFCLQLYTNYNSVMQPVGLKTFTFIENNFKSWFIKNEQSDRRIYYYIIHCVFPPGDNLPYYTNINKKVTDSFRFLFNQKQCQTNLLTFVCVNRAHMESNKNNPAHQGSNNLQNYLVGVQFLWMVVKSELHKNNGGFT